MAGSSDEIDTFSYAAPDDPRLKRFFIRVIERLTGQPYLKWVYEDNRAHPVAGESFWSAAIRRLELKLIYNEAELAKWPKTGPLVVVANHPFGVLDGLIICEIVSQVREDFRVLTNAVLLRDEELKTFLLPVDFADQRLIFLVQHGTVAGERGRSRLRCERFQPVQHLADVADSAVHNLKL